MPMNSYFMRNNGPWSSTAEERQEEGGLLNPSRKWRTDADQISFSPVFPSQNANEMNNKKRKRRRRRKPRWTLKRGSNAPWTRCVREACVASLFLFRPRLFLLRRIVCW